MYKDVINEFFNKCCKRIDIEKFMTLSDVFSLSPLVESRFNHQNVTSGFFEHDSYDNNLKKDCVSIKIDGYEDFFGLESNGYKKIRIDNLKLDLYKLYIEAINKMFLKKGYCSVPDIDFETENIKTLSYDFNGEMKKYIFIKTTNEMAGYFSEDINFKDTLDLMDFHINSYDSLTLVLASFLSKTKSFDTIKFVLIPYCNIFEKPYVRKKSILNNLRNLEIVPENVIDKIDVSSALCFFNEEFEIDANYVYLKYKKKFKNIKYLVTNKIGSLCLNEAELCLDLLKRNSNELFGTMYENSNIDFESWFNIYAQQNLLSWEREKSLEYLELLPENFNFYDLVEFFYKMVYLDNYFDETIEAELSSGNIVDDEIDNYFDTFSKKLSLDAIAASTLRDDIYTVGTKNNTTYENEFTSINKFISNSVDINLSKLLDEKKSYCDFFKTLLSSEINYKFLGLVKDIDNTYIATGYFKSIEVLLYNVLNKYYIDLNKKYDEIKKYDISNKDKIMLRNMVEFIKVCNEKGHIKNPSNVSFLIRKMEEWIENSRNGHFHKNVLSIEEFAQIRKDTYLLIYWIIGILPEMI